MRSRPRVDARGGDLRDGQGSLEDSYCRNVADRQLVAYTILIRIGALTEPFHRLHPVMLVEGSHCKLPDRSKDSLARKGLDDEIRIDSADAGSIDRAVRVSGQTAK